MLPSRALRFRPFSSNLPYYRFFHTMTRHNKQGNKGKSNAPEKPALTHFLCIPLVNPISKPQLEASIGRFKGDVCTPAPIKTAKIDAPAEENSVSMNTISSSSTHATASGEKPQKEIDKTSASTVQTPLIPEKAVRPIGSLHLTLGVMSLDEDRLAQAISLLQSLNIDQLLHEASTPKAKADDTLEQQEKLVSSDTPKQSLKVDPMTISLESLEPMQSPRKTSILYIKPQDPSDRLLPLCQALRTAFTEAGLSIPDTRPLKLHATIVNTIYVKGRKRKGKPQKEGEKATSVPEEGVKADEKNTSTETTETTSEPPTQHSTTETQPESHKYKDAPLTANTPSSGHGPSATSSLYIDATSLLPRYSSHIWASGVPISRIAICEMGVKKHVSADGHVEEAYKEVAVRRI